MKGEVLLPTGTSEWFILFTETAELPEFLIFAQETNFYFLLTSNSFFSISWI